VERLLNWFPLQAGETYFTPAHTVHAIGAGIVLCEIQQNSDITYRLWDYGRPRELHLEKAIPVSDLTVHPGAARPKLLEQGREELVRCQQFVTEKWWLEAGTTRRPEPQVCQLWICIEGRGTMNGAPFQCGEVWLMPEDGTRPAITAGTRAVFLRTYVP
jgi:mannose-6-phosphate isomerase